MKIILNPKYEFLREYLTHIEEHLDHEGKEIWRDRNVLRTLKVDGLTLVVKRYAQPSLTGRIATRIYRTSKGKKAYYRPLELRERGFESPEPIAFVRYDKSWTRTTTYFICLHSNYRYDMNHVGELPDGERRELISSFAHYAARLHEDGFLHRDFSADNILFDKVNGKYHFALIDTNSIRTGKPVSVERGCANFARLGCNEKAYAELAHDYAAARGADPDRCAQLIEKARERYASGNGG